MAEIFGTTGNDLLFGTPGDDVIDALEGNDDVVSAGDGNDTVNGGLGDENILGGAGDDVLIGGEGTDYIRGFTGNDILDGGVETDILIGEDGDDSILGGDGNDLILGDIDDANGLGDDVLNGGTGDDKITGGQGNDRVYGEGDKDIVSGGLGDDRVSGGAEKDLVFGAGGNDSVYGDRGDDEISGGSGSDLVFGGEGADTIDGVATLFSPQPGIGEIDELTGNEGSDLFLLGKISPTGTPAIFYDDGDTTTAGTNDYALITDFNPESEDKIKLVGEISSYSLAASPDGFRPGTAIYLNDGDLPELIAIVADVNPDTLSLDNPDQFQGSTPIPEVSVYAEPDTPLSEVQSDPGTFIFQLSEPAPEGGLTINFRAGDDDIDPDARDVDFDLEASNNIDDFSVIPLPDRTSFITIPEGVTKASLVVVPLVDNFVEADETLSIDLIPQAEYTVDTDNQFADLVITDGMTKIVGTEVADSLQGTNADDILSGLGGDDTLLGNLGNDLVVGGIGSDSLNGGTGIEDYALITDFDAESGDKIELVGEINNYSWGTSGEGLASGTAIYPNDGASPELIAVVADINPNHFGLDNSEQFVFETTEL